MQIDENGAHTPGTGDEAMAADKFARMMEDLYLDMEDLDPAACPPDRRFFLGDKEAWVYEHGNVCELVYVRTGEGDEELPTG